MLFYYAIIVNVWLVVNFFVTLLEELKAKGFEQKSEFKLNLKMLFGNILIQGLLSLFGYVLFLAPLLLLKNYVGIQLQGAIWFLPCLIVTDFLYYIKHFVSHKVKLCWNQHQVHHSSKVYSISTGYRKSWLEDFYSFIFYTPAVFLGFSPYLVLLCVFTVHNYSHLLHTKTSLNFNFLNYFFVTVEDHKIHHSSYKKHLDKNFGGILIIWDKLFNTYSFKEREGIQFGLTDQQPDSSPFKINFNVWITDFEKIKILNLKQKIIYFLSSPTAAKKKYS